MRFEVTAAFALGILLPVLETLRRGINYWTIEFTTMFEDYVAGGLLLIGAWSSYRGERVNPADLKPNSIQHEQLTEEQLRRAKKLHETFAEVDKSSLETWIDNFKRDMNPDKEIEIWERIAKAYTSYTSRKELSLKAKEDAFQTLLMCSMSSDEETIKSLKLNVLSQDEARKLCKEY